ncbi:MAG: DUF1206 domain-containing protein [Thermoanaerobaculia bacterium]
MSTAGEIERGARAAAPWIERLARVGYAAKAVVYTLIGFLALRAGQNGDADSGGAMAVIERKPLGDALLLVVALGLIGYALWRFAEAIVDPEGRGADAKGIAVRGYAFARGAFHAYLAWEAFRAALGPGGRGGGEEARHWTAVVMEKPFGPWLVGIAGLTITLYGIGQIGKAFTAHVQKKLEIASLSPGMRRWLVRISRYGVAARGVVFAIIGGFLVRAAMRTDASEARGIGGAIASIADHRWLLVVVAVGLISYGIYEAIKARYRRIKAA